MVNPINSICGKCEKKLDTVIYSMGCKMKGEINSNIFFCRECFDAATTEKFFNY